MPEHDYTCYKGQIIHIRTEKPAVTYLGKVVKADEEKLILEPAVDVNVFRQNLGKHGVVSLLKKGIEELLANPNTAGWIKSVKILTTDIHAIYIISIFSSYNITK